MLGCQRRVLALLRVFFLHQPLTSSSLYISYTWILVLGHQTTPRNLHSSNHKSTKCCSSYFLTHQATQTAPSNRVLSPFFILLSLYVTFWSSSPSARWHQASPQAAQVRLAAVIPPISVDFVRMVSLLLRSMSWFLNACVCAV